jgi:lactoylglutathione lyase
VAFVDDDLEQPKDQGVEAAAEPETMTVGGHDLAFVVDPDGYRVDLVERGTMKVGTRSSLRRAVEPTPRLLDIHARKA